MLKVRPEQFQAFIIYINKSNLISSTLKYGFSCGNLMLPYLLMMHYSALNQYWCTVIHAFSCHCAAAL